MANTLSSWRCPCGDSRCSRNYEWERANYYRTGYGTVTYAEASQWVGSIGDGSINNNNQKTMLDKFLNIFRSEPEKSFRKAEIIDDKGLLTSSGKDVLLNWLLKKHSKEFKAEIVDELLKKEETK